MQSTTQFHLGTHSLPRMNHLRWYDHPHSKSQEGKESNLTHLLNECGLNNTLVDKEARLQRLYLLGSSIQQDMESMMKTSFHYRKNILQDNQYSH